MSASPSLRFVLVLGLMQAMGPFAIDMYLPAMPAMAADLQASIGTVQASLFAFFVALGVGQIVCGPLSDLYGRRPPLLLGLGLFAAASVGCALAPNWQTLVALRLLQGFAAAAATAIPRAVVRDCYSGHEAARVIGMLTLVFSVSPVLAPLAGSYLIDGGGWRAVFWAIAAIALLGIGLVVAWLPETRPARGGLSLGAQLATIGRAYRDLLRDGHFIGLAAIGGLGMSTFIIYLSNSPFVLIGHYGLSPRAFSLAFSANAVAFVGAAQLASRLAKRYGIAATVRGALTGYAALALLLLALVAAGITALTPLLGLLFAGFGLLGLVMPNASVLAMEAQAERAGTAAALLGTLHFLLAAVLMTVVGHFAQPTPLPMVVGIAACAVAACALSVLTLRTTTR